MIHLLQLYTERIIACTNLVQVKIERSNINKFPCSSRTEISGMEDYRIQTFILKFVHNFIYGIIIEFKLSV